MNTSDWTANTLFTGLKLEQLNQVRPHMTQGSFKTGEVIMQQGDEGDFVFFLEEGTVDIRTGELLLGTSTAGQHVGLMSLIDNSPRSATITASSDCSGKILSKTAWNTLIQGESQSLASSLLMNFLNSQQAAIRNTNSIGLQETRAKLQEMNKSVNSARFFVNILMGLVFFMFLLGFLKEKATKVDDTFISFIVIMFYGIFSYVYVRYSGISQKAFGLTMHNFKAATLYSLKATGLIIALLFAVKWVLVSFMPETFGEHVIEFWASEDGSLSTTLLIMFMYSVHAVVQEFVARGCIQGGLMQFLSGKYAAASAIILSTLLFSSFHLMMDIKFAFLTIGPSLFWGYLFHKHRNVLAVAFSHIIIGLVTLFVLNMGS